MKPKKSSGIEPRHIILTALALFMLGAIVLTVPRPQPPTEQPVRVLSVTSVTNTVPYTEAEMHQFWDKHLKQLIEVQWLNRTLPYPELNQRLTTICDSIRAATGTNLRVGIITTYHPLSTGILGQAGWETNQTDKVPYASIGLFMPAIMDYYRDTRIKFNITDEQFPIGVLVAIMHESEHVQVRNRHTNQIDIAEESRAWFDTCRNTIDPLVEKYDLTVFGADAAFYKAWLSDGKTMGRAWNDNLYRLYGPLAIIRQKQLREELNQ